MLLFKLHLSANFKSYNIGSYQTLSDMYFDLKYIRKVVDVDINIAFKRQFQIYQFSYQMSGDMLMRNILSPLEPRAAMHNWE